MLRSAWTPYLSLFAALSLFLSACGDQSATSGDAAPSADSYDRLAMEKRILSIAVVQDIPTRKKALSDALADVAKDFAHSRHARRHQFKLLEMQADVVESRKGLTFARPMRKDRQDAMKKALTADPGDGNLRGHVAYELFRDGDPEGGWKVLEAGLLVTDQDDENEEALLYFLGSFPSLTFTSGSRELQDATSQRFVDFIKKLKARRKGRAPTALDDSIDLNLITWLIRVGDKSAATELLDQLEAKDPARSEILDLRRRLQ